MTNWCTFSITEVCTKPVLFHLLELWQWKRKSLLMWISFSHKCQYLWIRKLEEEEIKLHGLYCFVALFCFRKYHGIFFAIFGGTNTSDLDLSINVLFAVQNTVLRVCAASQMSTLNLLGYYRCVSSSLSISPSSQIS